MRKPVKVDTQRSVNGGREVMGVDEITVTSCMLLWSVMMTRTGAHKKTIHAQDVKTITTTETVW